MTSQGTTQRQNSFDYSKRTVMINQDCVTRREYINVWYFREILKLWNWNSKKIIWCLLCIVIKLNSSICETYSHSTYRGKIWGPLTCGWPPVSFYFKVSFSYVIAYAKMLLVKRKPSHWLSPEMQIMETERRGWVRPTCATFEQEPWAEPQLHLRWSWSLCAIFLWKLNYRAAV